MFPLFMLAATKFMFFLIGWGGQGGFFGTLKSTKMLGQKRIIASQTKIITDQLF